MEGEDGQSAIGRSCFHAGTVDHRPIAVEDARCCGYCGVGVHGVEGHVPAFAHLASDRAPTCRVPAERHRLELEPRALSERYSCLRVRHLRLDKRIRIGDNSTTLHVGSGLRHTGQGITQRSRKLRTLQPRVGLVQPADGEDPCQSPPKNFYLSPEWIALRDRVRREAGGRCQAPGCGRIEQRMCDTD